MTRGYPKQGGRHGDDGSRSDAPEWSQLVNSWMRSKKISLSFFGMLLSFHTPHNPPERLLNKYKKTGRSLPIAKYYAMCDWFDETCGDLVAILDEHKIRENTLIKHDGQMVGSKTRIKAVMPHGSKQTPHEGGIRIPIFFNWPGTLKPADREELVSSNDIFPTLLTAAGSKHPKKIPGLDLMKHLKSGKR